MDNATAQLFVTVVLLGFSATLLAGAAILWVLVKRGYKRTSIAIVAAGLLATYLPVATGYLAERDMKATIEALSYTTDAIDFEGKTVLFGESCVACDHDIAEFAVRHGGLAAVYRGGTDNLNYVVNRRDDVFTAWSNGTRFTHVSPPPTPDAPSEWVSGVDVPFEALDYVVFHIEGHNIKRHGAALGLSEEEAADLNSGYFIYEGYPQIGDQPVVRLLSARYVPTKPFYTNFFGGIYEAWPAKHVNRDYLRSWFCAAPRDSPYFPPDVCPSE